jgi:hypothetical protein
VCVLCKTFDILGDKVTVYTSSSGASIVLETHIIHGADGTRFENRSLKFSAIFSCISDSVFEN